jgi:hypothetical protein
MHVSTRLEQAEVGIDEDGEPIISCVVVPTDRDGSRANVRVPPSAKIALDALYEAIAESVKWSRAAAFL